MQLLAQAVLDALKTGSELGVDDAGRLQGVLHLSLQRLQRQPAAVQMFLDVAAVLSGHHKVDAMVVWQAGHGAGAAHRGWTALQRHGLVRETSDGTLAVHDVIRALARHMLKDEGREYYGSRLWHEEDGTPCIPAPQCQVTVQGGWMGLQCVCDEGASTLQRLTTSPWHAFSMLDVC
jgi:hypothetical protein